MNSMESWTQNLSDLDIDIASFPETNTNWQHLSLPIVKNHLRRYFSHVVLAPAHAPPRHNSQYQPGGVLSLFTNQLSGRITQNLPDPMGRWITTIMNGKMGKKIAMITLYQPPEQHAQIIGPQTVWAQQT